MDQYLFTHAYDRADVDPPTVVLTRVAPARRRRFRPVPVWSAVLLLAVLAAVAIGVGNQPSGSPSSAVVASGADDDAADCADAVLGVLRTEMWTSDFSAGEALYTTYGLDSPEWKAHQAAMNAGVQNDAFDIGADAAVVRVAPTVQAECATGHAVDPAPVTLPGDACSQRVLQAFRDDSEHGWGAGGQVLRAELGWKARESEVYSTTLNVYATAAVSHGPDAGLAAAAPQVQRLCLR